VKLPSKCDSCGKKCNKWFSLFSRFKNSSK
jgi:hypothetical protein